MSISTEALALAREPKRESRRVPPPRILVVEDDPETRTLLRETFAMNGFPVATAADGTEAERIASKQGFDVFVIDIRLPGFDGIELMRRLARKGTRAGVILISAYLDVQTLQRGMDAGAAHVLSKPFSLKRLVLLVEELGSSPRTGLRPRETQGHPTGRWR